MFERILVATDGSDDARAAQTLAFRLAATLGSRITLLHVTDVRLVEGPLVQTLAPLWGEFTTRPFQPEVVRAYRERGRALLDEAAALARESGCEVVETRLDVAVTDDAIIAHAAAADLLALGRRGEHAGFGGEQIGSTLTRVLRRSPHPVLVARAARAPRRRPARASIPEGARADERVSAADEPVTGGNGGAPPGSVPRRLLVAYDSSEPSIRALDLAIRYAGAVGGDIRLVHAGGEEGDAVLEIGLAVLEDHGVPCEGARIDAEPGAAVHEALARWEPEALFMGRHGGGRLRDLLFGSQTHRICGSVDLPIFLTG